MDNLGTRGLLYEEKKRGKSLELQKEKYKFKISVILLLLCSKGFRFFKITTSFIWGYIRSCSEQSRQKAGSFNIMLKVALVTGESISISARCNGSGRGFLHFDSSLHFRNVKGSCFSPRPPQSSLRPWLTNLYCAFYHSLPHTNIHPPRPAHTCSQQSPAWHWPTLWFRLGWVSSLFNHWKDYKKKATCYCVATLSLAFCCYLPPVSLTHTSSHNFIPLIFSQHP